MAFDKAALKNAQAAIALHEVIEKAGRDLVVSAGVNEADPGASAVSTYLAAIGLHVSPETVAKLLVLLGVLGLEVGSLTAGLLVPASVSSLPLPTGAAKPNQSRQQDRDQTGVQAIDPDEVFHWHLAPENTASDDGVQSDGEGVHSVREKVLEALAVVGSVAIPLRTWSTQLGCSKTALVRALERLVAEGLVAQVQASKGRGSAYRLVAAA